MDIRNLVVLALSLLAGCASVKGSYSSSDYTAFVIESLRSYERVTPAVKSTSEDQKKLEAKCLSLKKSHRLHTNIKCAEWVYLKGDNYLVIVNYKNDKGYPKIPFVPFAFNGDSYEQDTSIAKEFLNKWEPELLSEYLGDDYNDRYPSAELINMTQYVISIEVQIREVDDIKQLIQTERLSSVFHVGKPGQEFEVVLP